MTWGGHLGVGGLAYSLTNVEEMRWTGMGGGQATGTGGISLL